MLVPQHYRPPPGLSTASVLQERVGLARLVPGRPVTLRNHGSRPVVEAEPNHTGFHGFLEQVQMSQEEEESLNNCPPFSGRRRPMDRSLARRVNHHRRVQKIGPICDVHARPFRNGST